MKFDHVLFGFGLALTILGLGIFFIYAPVSPWSEESNFAYMMGLFTLIFGILILCVSLLLLLGEKNKMSKEPY